MRTTFRIESDDAAVAACVESVGLTLVDRTVAAPQGDVTEEGRAMVVAALVAEGLKIEAGPIERTA